jgi:hypothetical protein
MASLVDVLPDGMTYVEGSASLPPSQRDAGDQPIAGPDHDYVWALPADE